MHESFAAIFLQMKMIQRNNREHDDSTDFARRRNM